MNNEQRSSIDEYNHRQLAGQRTQKTIRQSRPTIIGKTPEQRLARAVKNGAPEGGPAVTIPHGQV